MRDLTEILKLFNIVSPIQTRKLDLTGMNVNEAYLVELDSGFYILKKVTNQNVDLVNSASAYVDLLKEFGFTCTPKNLRNREEAFVVTVDDSNWELQEFIQGKQIKNSDLNFENIQSLALTIASFHLTLLNKQNNFGLINETTYVKMFDGEQHEKMKEAVEKLINLGIPHEDKDLLERYWDLYNKERDDILKVLPDTEEKLQKSVIHRDLNKGNILFKLDTPDVAAIVDWDTIMWGNVLQDICYLCSMYLVTTNQDGIDLAKSRENIQAFVDTYQSKIKLNSDEKDLFTTLARILKVRGTRWSVKKYLDSFVDKNKNEESLRFYEKIKGNFTSTLTKWINEKETILKVFESIKL